MSWSDLAAWWRAEVAGDPAYETVVTPLLLEMLQPQPGHRYLDIGCGDGRVMRSVAAAGAACHGVDVSADLVEDLAGAVVGNALDLPFAADSYEGAYCVLTLEHIADHVGFFEEASRVVAPGGTLVLVVNHPAWTAPGSTPITDTDGEVLWRPGGYFSAGSTDLPAGDDRVTFHHRTLGDLLNAASDASFRLERMLERPHHELEDQAGIPRLLACRWRS